MWQDDETYLFLCYFTLVPSHPISNYRSRHIVIASQTISELKNLISDLVILDLKLNVISAAP